MSDLILSKGWAKSPIGALCSLNNGRAFKPTEWVKQGLPIVRIQNLNNTSANFNYFSGEFRERYHLTGGELLFAWSGTPGTSFGAHVWRGGEALLNQHIFRIDFDRIFFDKRFFRHAINQTLTELINVAHGGVGLRHVTKGTFEKTEILIPPLAEQKRIADKLESVLARVDASRERLNRVRLILKRFRQSVLAAATSGELSADWRQLHRQSSGAQATPYLLSTFGKLGVVSGGLTKNARRDQFELRMPYLRVANVHANKLKLDDITEIGLTEAEFKKTALSGGDILIVEGNGSLEHIGRAALWNGEIKDCVHQNHIIRWRAGASILPKFALLCLMSPAGRSRIVELASSTTGLHTLSVSKIAALPLPEPAIEEQREIVHRVEALFGFADRLEARLDIARAATDRLTPALLAKAFRGELVPQDPADEPASELLKRLAAQRDAAPKLKRGINVPVT